MSTFTSCPLAFRFSYIDKLPEAPSAPASKGSLVHLALQHLMWRPPEGRTIENGILDLARAVAEFSADPEFAQLDLTEEEWAQFHADSEFYAVERRLTELGFARPRTEPLARWLDGVVEAAPPGVATAPLPPLLALHYRHRFDPEGLTDVERARLRAEAERWLADHASAAASPPAAAP